MEGAGASLTWWGLSLCYVLVLVVMGLSIRERYGIEREIFWSSLRAAAQLVAMGYAIHWIFQVEGLWFSLVVLTVMALYGGRVSAARGRGVPEAGRIAGIAVVAASAFTVGTLVLLGVIRPEARYVLPLGGMIVGSAMNGSSLALNRLRGELELRVREVEGALALGLSGREAARPARREAVLAATIPAVDSLKTVGVIHLPGMMSGMIIAGASPIEAIQYQLVVLYMLLAAKCLGALFAATLASRNFFNEAEQLHMPPIG
ncbi:MAG: iron export ABC transporter permease subunit FetB [Myxococcales bacterium]|nr:iron export ABC transporter permease subunit FetB [Myxococcales bacterium]